VIGGGLAGLAAALAVERRGLSCRVLEASDGVGGRARTDVTPDGFLLDRGFAIALSSYPEQRAVLASAPLLRPPSGPAADAARRDDAAASAPGFPPLWAMLSGGGVGGSIAELRLRPFFSGAYVRTQAATGADGAPAGASSWSCVADPLRHPAEAVASLSPSHPVGSVLDKVRIGVLRLAAASRDWDALRSAGDQDGAAEAALLAGPTSSLLAAASRPGSAGSGGADPTPLGPFDASMVDRFLRPFLGGIFFDRSLGTASRLTLFVFRALQGGLNCLPAAGIGALAAAVEGRLREGTVTTGWRASGLAAGRGEDDGAVWTVSEAGGRAAVRARAVVVATEGPTAARLLRAAAGVAPDGEVGGPADGGGGADADVLALAARAARPGVGGVTVYFAADALTVAESKLPLYAEPVLWLNGSGHLAADDASAAGDGGLDDPTWGAAGWSGAVINHACCPSAVAPTYAPAGSALLSLSLAAVPTGLDDAALSTLCLAQADRWWPEARPSARWRLLSIVRTPYAQPPQRAGDGGVEAPARVAGLAADAPPLLVAGDHASAATHDGALRSGRRAGEAAAEALLK